MNKKYLQIEKEPAAFQEPDLRGSYTYADYLRWTIEERLELIKGKIFKMSPAPARRHQELSQRINAPLYNFLLHKPCEVYTAPFDVRLSTRGKSHDEVTTVVQPDLCVICDRAKLDERGCMGAPDIVVEILSPGNNKKELRNKYEVYEESGVKEYWIVWPEAKTFLKYTLNDEGRYQPSRVLTLGDTVTTPILPGFALSLDEVFEEALP
jgi:Uma2 family endonuclease